MRKAIMALEEMDEERVEPVPGEEEVSMDFADAPEADMAEAVEAGDEVEDSDEAVEEASDTADTLEAVADKVEETLPEGGMGEAEAEALEVAVEHLLMRVGYSKKRAATTFPAMESFSKEKTPEQRLAATKLAMENIRERAGQIWAQIVEAIKKAMAFVKQFFQHAFNSGVKLKKRAEDIAKKAASMKNAEFEQGAKVKQGAELSVGGSHAEGAGFVDAVKKHVGQEALNENRTAKLRGAVDAINKVLETEGEGAVGAATKNFIGQFKAGEVKLEFGGASIVTEVSEEGSAKVSVTSTTSGGSAEVAAATPDEAGEIASLIGSHVNAMNGRLGAAAKESEQAAHELISKIQAGSKTEGSKASEVSKVIKSAIALTTSAATAIAKYDMKVCNAALGYAASSLGKAKMSKSTEVAPA